MKIEMIAPTRTAYGNDDTIAAQPRCAHNLHNLHLRKGH